MVKCCGPCSRLALHLLSSNNVDFWNFLWEPTTQKKSYHVQHPNPLHPTKKFKRDSLKKTSPIAEVLPWRTYLYSISITSVKIAAGWHCGTLPWSMVPRVHFRRWIFFEPSHNLSLETGDAHCNISKAKKIVLCHQVSRCCSPGTFSYQTQYYKH